MPTRGLKIAQNDVKKGALPIMRTFYLIDMIANTEFSNCPNVLLLFFSLNWRGSALK